MPSTTSIWGRPYPLSSDPPAVHTDIQALANSLETTPLFPTVASASRTGIAGESVVVSGGKTLTLPASPAKGDRIQIIADGSATGAAPVAVTAAGGKVIAGVGSLSVSSFVLGTPLAAVTLQYEGTTTWRMIAGMQDTGWVALSSVHLGVSAPRYPLAARQAGDELRFTGSVSMSVSLSSGTQLAALPAGIAHPSQIQQFTVDLQGLSLSTAGNLTLNGSVSSGASFDLGNSPVLRVD